MKIKQIHWVSSITMYNVNVLLEEMGKVLNHSKNVQNLKETYLSQFSYAQSLKFLGCILLEIFDLNA